MMSQVMKIDNAGWQICRTTKSSDYYRTDCIVLPLVRLSYKVWKCHIILQMIDRQSSILCINTHYSILLFSELHHSYRKMSKLKAGKLTSTCHQKMRCYLPNINTLTTMSYLETRITQTKKQIWNMNADWPKMYCCQATEKQTAQEKKIHDTYQCCLMLSVHGWTLRSH